MSREYKDFLQYTYEDWIGLDSVIPFKLMKIEIDIRFPIELYKVDAHPHASWVQKENEEKKKKLELLGGKN